MDLRLHLNVAVLYIPQWWGGAVEDACVLMASIKLQMQGKLWQAGNAVHALLEVIV